MDPPRKAHSALINSVRDLFKSIDSDGILFAKPTVCLNARYGLDNPYTPIAVVLLGCAYPTMQHLVFLYSVVYQRTASHSLTWF